MRHPFQILFFLVLLTTGMNPEILAQNDTIKGIELKKNESAGKTYALIVGISEYKYIPQLRYADDDAVAFRDFLLNTKIISNPDNIHFLIDSMATSPEIFNHLKKITDKVKPDNNDRVFIYFAGSGAIDPESNEGYLLCYRSDSIGYEVSDAIFIPHFESWINALAKKAKVFLILDACNTGSLSGQKNSPSQITGAFDIGFPGIIKMLSARPGQLSMEKEFPDGGHGVFTYFLLEALYGLGVTDSAKHITLGDVERYVVEKVSVNTEKRQVPLITGNSFNEIICEVNPEARKVIMERKKSINQTNTPR